MLATNESKQQLSSLMLKLEPTHKHTPKKQTKKKTHIGAELKERIKRDFMFFQGMTRIFLKDRLQLKTII